MNSEGMPVWVPRAIVTGIITIALSLAALSVLAKLSGLIIGVLMALFLSFGLEPPVTALTKRGVRRGLATAVVMLSVVFVLLIMFGSIIPAFVSQLQELVTELPALLQSSANYLQSTWGLDTGNIVNSVNPDLNQLSQNIAGYSGDIVGSALNVSASVLGVLFQIASVGLFTYYFVAEGPQFRKFAVSLVPKRRQALVEQIWETAIHKTGDYFYSRLILAAISAAAAFIFLLIVGAPFPFAFALWVGIISQFIPTIGSYFAAGVPLIIFVMDKPMTALWFLLYVILYQQIENYILSPKITARTMEIHPAVAFGGVLAGGMLAGFIGAFLALPLVGVIQSAGGVYLKRYREETNK